MSEPLLTYDQAAGQLRVSERTVRRLIDAGELEVVRVATAPRIRPEDIDAYIARQRSKRSVAAPSPLSTPGRPSLGSATFREQLRAVC